ncbi:methyltransferase domain-containing protein [Hydrogenophaga sp.]|uniref:methyltransferase domain-containing protein n=1 Tax=Hydrogenophaga sp. TaxID=1904254 RepID=UPI003563BB5B
MNKNDVFSVPAFPCRHCGASVTHEFADLGLTPLCQTQIAPARFNQAERYFPLQAYVCSACWLVQLRDCISSADVFTDDYPYFSSFSASWLAHAKAYVDEMVERLQLGSDSLVMELASNDGYLLRHFKPHGVPVLGVEPSRSVADAAIALGIPTEIRFFGRDTATDLRARYGAADLIAGNNVLAHVPDINDFVAGVQIALKPQGTVTFEFPHLLNLMQQNQFDTIYHEHFSYLSLHAVRAVFRTAGLDIYDVRKLSTHGGSLRVFGQLAGAGRPVTDQVAAVLAEEAQAGLLDVKTYGGFAEQARATKRDILDFLIQARRQGKRVAGYGAPGKGNTLLNYCGIGTDLIDFTVDANPAKQHTFAPGSRIPIYPPDHIRETKPDYLFILPWNLKEEIMAQTAYIREWGGQWVTPIPTPKVWSEPAVRA